MTEFFKLYKIMGLSTFMLSVFNVVPLKAEETKGDVHSQSVAVKCPKPDQVASYLKLSVTVVQPGVPLIMSGEKFIVGLVKGDKAGYRTGIDAPKTLRLLETAETGVGVAPEKFCRYYEGTISGGAIKFTMDVVAEHDFKGYWNFAKNAGQDVRFYGDYYKAQKVLNEALGIQDMPPKPVADSSGVKMKALEMPENIIEAYKILGVKSNATSDEVKEAYKKLAMQYHPDKNRDNKDRATENFKAVSESYQLILKNIEEKEKFMKEFVR